MSTTTTLPFAGGEFASFDPQDGFVSESTSSGSFATPYARCSLGIQGGSGGAVSPSWPAVNTTFYMHFDLLVSGNNNMSSTIPMIKFLTGPGGILVATLRALNDADTAATFSIYIAGATDPIGSFTLPDVLQTWDIKFDFVNSIVQVFINGTMTQSYTSIDLGTTGIGQIVLGGSYGTEEFAFWSQVICDDVSHVGDKLYTFPINTLSAVNNQWTGTVSQVDEIVTNDASYNYAASAGLVSTYFASGFSLGTFNVVAIIVAGRISRQTTGPQNIQMALRVAGGNYFSTTIGNFQEGYQACCAPWVLDPQSGTGWAPSVAQAIEGGQMSVA